MFRSKVTMHNMVIILIAILLPIGSILTAAWYFGYIFNYVEEYNDPCLLLYTERTCKGNDICTWSNKRKLCSLDSECMGMGQQNCGEGCHWDATIKKPGSNLYGLCRPATLAKKGEQGTQEIK